MIAELRAYMLSDPTVQGLVGTRIYPSVLPQNALFPSITMQTISAARRPTMRHNDDLPRKRVQIDCWSPRIEEAERVAEAIRELFHYYESGEIGESPGLYVAAVFAEDERMLYDSEPKLHRVSVDYSVFHVEG